MCNSMITIQFLYHDMFRPLFCHHQVVLIQPLSTVLAIPPSCCCLQCRSFVRDLTKYFKLYKPLSRFSEGDALYVNTHAHSFIRTYSLEINTTQKKLLAVFNVYFSCNRPTGDQMIFIRKILEEGCGNNGGASPFCRLQESLWLTSDGRSVGQSVRLIAEPTRYYSLSGQLLYCRGPSTLTRRRACPLSKAMVGYTYVAYGPVARQRPRNEQIYNSHCYVTAPQKSIFPRRQENT
jgi:hypothetical protein